MRGEEVDTLSPRAPGPGAVVSTVVASVPQTVSEAAGMIEEGWVWVFVAIDHRTLEPWACVRKRGDRFAALEPVLGGARSHFGAAALNVARGLALRHDHGPHYVSDHFQGELRWLGIIDSPAFVREPEGNAMAEWFIKQLKSRSSGAD